MRPPRRVERLGPGDVVQLVTDVGPVPMHVGALLRLGPGASSTADVVATLAERAACVPRLGQVVATPPPGLGRPYWVDATAGPPPVAVRRLADAGALLNAAVEAVITPLPRGRPPWRAVVLEVAGRPAGVVVALHHVLADGVAGLGLLAALADPGAATVTSARSARTPPPTVLDLLRDITAERRARLRGLARTRRRLHAARSELLGGTGRAPACSLNAPTGPRRRAATVEADLAAVRRAAHAAGGTVNDALLVATTGALGRLLTDRGESVPALVVSVPVAARREDASGALGNLVGVMPVRVGLSGTPSTRLAAVARDTRARRGAVRGASTALVAPLFRVLAAAGVFRWFVDRQRLVSTFLTNVAGPPRPLHLAGRTVTAVTPLTVTAGNVGVAFAALSYAGRLGVTVVVDPDVVPELERLAGHLDAELGALTGAATALR